MKIAKIIVSLVLVYFMTLQFNDAQQYGNHDAWFWIFFYLAAALLTAAMVKWQQPPWLLPGIIGFCLGSALFRMQDEVGNFDFTAPFRATAIPSQMNKATQQPNEIDALLVVGIWFGVVAYCEKRQRTA
ncbi:hypothetical protein [Roseibacillus ishigakijimensis]|uniref:Transmembrane family 220, helix n=1 Tax=Roseibacillus ishigakijimensis TaxID=454146 RepID=A0A934RVF2_9BACT|nr:hypothetical protein [Roseibacillus ishigakijimensis]MBK1835176.1 hypothetical protein [Roseibacillus ishigakijimensis]